MKYDYRHSRVEEDRKAAQEVWDRVERNQSRQTREDEPNLGDEEGKKQREGDDDGREKAVQVMQRNYRKHVDRRTAQGRNLTTSMRFKDGLRQRKLEAAGKEQDDGKNDATSRWQRTGLYAQKLGEGKSTKLEGPVQEPSEEEEAHRLGRNDKERKKIQKERFEAKHMEDKYWLEVVDSKHRYASNLKYYHQEWNNTDTDENFFHWLDKGGGKHVDLEQCPRSQLDKERITYLTAEQREVYRVIVNDEGLLVWAKDGSPLDTSKYHEDVGPEHGGVVPISEERFKEKQAEDKEMLKKAKEDNGSSMSSSDYEDSSSSSSSDEEIADEVRAGTKPYGDKGGTAGQGKGLKEFKQRVKYYASPAHLTDHILRKTVNKNTWLYVSDLTNGLFVSIKKTGGFQHSSFLYGARVTSAGLLKASDGKLTSLSPLSGHYRAGTMHFKAFVRGLEEEGVDMSSVSISKSVMTIRGIEKYGKFTKSKKAVTNRIKSIVTGQKTPEEEQAEKAELTREKISTSEKPQQGNDDGSSSRVGREGGEGSNKVEKGSAGRKLGGDEPLPGEGKNVEEMNEEERMDRGIALLLKAFERGLQKEVEENERHAEPPHQPSNGQATTHA